MYKIDVKHWSQYLYIRRRKKEGILGEINRQ